MRSLRSGAGLLLCIPSHQREAEGVEVVVGDFAEQLPGSGSVARPLRRDRELILDVGVERRAMPEVFGGWTSMK